MLSFVQRIYSKLQNKFNRTKQGNRKTLPRPLQQKRGATIRERHAPAEFVCASGEALVSAGRADQATVSARAEGRRRANRRDIGGRGWTKRDQSTAEDGTATR